MKKVILVTILAVSLTFLFVQGNITKAAMSWSEQESGTSNAFNSISFATKEIGLVGGASGSLFRTTDGGSTWEIIDTYAQNILSVSTYYNSEDGNVYAAILIDSDSDYYTTQDLTAETITWTPHDLGKTPNTYGGIKIADESTVYVVSNAIGEHFMLYGPFGSGAVTDLSYVGVDSSQTLYNIDCIDSIQCWAVGHMGMVVSANKSDGIYSDEHYMEPDSAMLGIDMINNTLGYASGAAGTILVYNGTSWVDVPTDITGTIHGISCTDSNTCWNVGDSGAIYKTADGGTSWDAETSGIANDLNGVSFYDEYHGWAAGASGVILAQLDETAPVTTADPAGGTYTEAQTVTLSAVDSESDVDATYYTTDGTDPTTGSSVYSTPLEISETTTLKFFSVDNAGNEESVNTEEYIINITPTPTPEPTPTDTTEDYAGGELKIKDIELDKTYHNTKNNTDFYFYRKPTREYCVKKKLYIKVLRKSGYKKAFKHKKAFKTHYKLKLNVGKAKKDTWSNVKKRMKYKVALRYTDAQLAKKGSIKEKNLRLFIKDRKNLWRGPYTVYQNRSTNTFKFKIRNFKHLNELASVSSTNRTFSPTFYFRNLKKVRFVIATKKAFKKNYPFNLADQNNYDFE